MTRHRDPALAEGDRPGRCFAVSKVQLDPAGRISAVLWGQVDTGKNTWATPEVVVPVGVAVDALHAGAQVFALFPSIHGHSPERRFVVANYDGSRKTIVLDGPSTHEREVHDMDRLDGPAPGRLMQRPSDNARKVRSALPGAMDPLGEAARA